MTRKLGEAWEQGNLNTTLPATLLYEQTRNFPKQLCCSEWFFTCSQMSYCTAHLRTISDTALVMYLGPAYGDCLQHKGCIWDSGLCVYTRPTNSLVTRSVALSGNPSGMLYSSFVIFWKHRYSFLGARQAHTSSFVNHFLWNRLHKLRVLLYSFLVIRNPSALS